MNRPAYLYADYPTMVAALGEPNPDDIGDPDKVDVEWHVPYAGHFDYIEVYNYHDVQPRHLHADVRHPGRQMGWHVQPEPVLEALASTIFGEGGYAITRGEFGLEARAI